LVSEEAGMKIFVICDLEGVAGVVDKRQQCWVDGDYYLQARRLATLELNALVEGALEGGASEVVAWDGHWLFPGCIDMELLHPECKLIMGAGDGGPIGLDSSFAGLFQLWLHAMSGAEAAVLAHGGWTLNGRRLGEIGMSALIAGLQGVPCVFVSGDGAAADEARALAPSIETVIVKESLCQLASGLNQSPALTLAPQKVRLLIREGARRAMERIPEIAPLRIEPPYTLLWHFENPAHADEMLAPHPQGRRLDEATVEFRSNDFQTLPI
jgi:D-amino peptidase